MQAHPRPPGRAGNGAGRGPAAQGWDEDQCWTLARITEVVRRRFRVDYTLAGMDVLLHRISWSVHVRASQAAERQAHQFGIGKPPGRADDARQREPHMIVDQHIQCRQ